MWKTVFSLRTTILFCPQANVDEFSLFHRLCGENFCFELCTGKVSTIHSPCGKIFDNNGTVCTFLAPARKVRKEAGTRGVVLSRSRAPKTVNYGMIAAGNHGHFDSLRGAQPLVYPPARIESALENLNLNSVQAENVPIFCLKVRFSGIGRAALAE